MFVALLLPARTLNNKKRTLSDKTRPTSRQTRIGPGEIANQSFFRWNDFFAAAEKNSQDLFDVGSTRNGQKDVGDACFIDMGPVITVITSII